jgi:hypothetical protein
VLRVFRVPGWKKAGALGSVLCELLLCDGSRPKSKRKLRHERWDRDSSQVLQYYSMRPRTIYGVDTSRLEW